VTRNYERKYETMQTDRSRRHNMRMTEVAGEKNCSLRKATNYAYKRKMTGQSIVIRACTPSNP
jgi:hypothetical protein